jgi:hypothetical protein
MNDQVPPPEKFRDLFFQQAIKCHSKLPKPSPIDIEDLVGECGLVYCRCRDGWDPTRGVKFITYLYTAIWRHLGGILRKAYRRPMTGPLSAEENGADLLSIPAGPERRPTRMAHLFVLRISPDAARVVRELLSPSRRFRAWERRYKRIARSPRLVLDRVFRFLGYPAELRREVAAELSAAL